MFDSQNDRYYHEVLEQRRKRVHHVWPEIADTWMLHHDNTPCHNATSVNEFFTKNGIPVVPQSSYSPDLSPCDIPFPVIQIPLQRSSF